MLKIYFGLVLCVIYSKGIEIQDDTCELPLQKLSFFAPLIFSKNGILKETEYGGPDNKFVKILNGEEVILSCNPNYFVIYSTRMSITGKCKGGRILEVNGKDKDFLKDLACEVRAIEEIVTSIAGCPGNLTSTEFGFTHPISEKSYILGEVCYDDVKGQINFVHFKVTQKYQSENIEKIALGIKNKNYFRQKHPMSRYKLDFFKAARADTLNDHLSNILESEVLPVVVQDHLFRGNLLWNPQFYSILKLPWNYVMIQEETYNILENLTFKFKTEQIIDVYFGTHGVLAWSKNGGELISLYMTDDQRFPIPEFIWYLMKVENKVTAVIILNGEPTNTKSLCKSKCHQLKFVEDVHVTRALNSGRIICCEYSNFKKFVPEMPTLEGSYELLTM